MIRNCVEFIDSEVFFSIDKPAPKELERFAKSVDSLSKKESVKGERSDKNDVSLLLVVNEGSGVGNLVEFCGVSFRT